MSLASSLQLHVIDIIYSYIPLAQSPQLHIIGTVYSYMSLAQSLQLYIIGIVYSYMSMAPSLQLHAVGTVYTVTCHWYCLHSYMPMALEVVCKMAAGQVTHPVTLMYTKL